MIRYIVQLFTLSIIVLLGVEQSLAQVRVGFAPRTSTQAPAPYTGVSNYNLQGDFAMIGNTNLTLVDYGNNTGNNESMRYVDIDNDANTFNSSSAALMIPDANCSEIIYAGLYWTGRAHDATTSPDVFTVIKTLGHNYQENNITVTVSRIGSLNSYYPRYTLTNGSSTVQIEFTNNTGNNRVLYREGTTSTINTQSWVNRAVSYNASGNTGTATFNSALSLTIGGQQITITGLQRDTRTNRTESQYQTTSLILQSKELDKRKVQLKKEGQLYQEVTALNNAIYYPPTGGNVDGVMYSAYSDVTQYVREHGVGNYFVADIALREGNGGGTGFYGGWGMVVVYKNPQMKWRDITVFDGHAYVAGSATVNHELPISGFRAAQNGAVNVTVGMMAGEGDVSISGDYFQIRNSANSNWVNLNHSGNSTTNFFNSSISTGGNTRNPNLTNNTGLDIARFDLTNTNNSLIANNATNTRFRYGSTQDTYVIFNMVLAVDAYVPEVVGENSPGSALTIHNGSINPGEDLEFDLKIYNKGEEAVNNTKIEIPIPYNLHYDPTGTSVIEGSHSTIKIPNNTNVTWEKPDWAPVGATPDLYPGGTLVWNIGTLPYDASKSILQGTLKYRFKVTQNCALLSSVGDCGLEIRINGKITGTGATSRTAVSSDLVRAYGAGDCDGPIYDDFVSTIAVSEDFIQNCTPPPVEERRLQFIAFCSVPNNQFPRADIVGFYPLGTKFFSSIPTSYESNVNVVTGDFPINTDGTRRRYYAIAPGMEPNCYMELEIRVEIVNTSPTASNVNVCFGDDVLLDVTRSATGVNNDYGLYYFDSESSGTPLATVPAPTAVGTYTYWVAEGREQGGVLCIGPKVQFIITIHALPTVQQDVEDIRICENNDMNFTVTASTPSGAITYVWEYATATAPTVWNTLDNNTYSGQITVNNGSLNISHAVRVGATSINGIKVRLIAKNSNDCEAVSNEVAIEIKDCRAITNPMLPNKAGM